MSAPKPPKFGMPMTYQQALAISDRWWRIVGTGKVKKG